MTLPRYLRHIQGILRLYAGGRRIRTLSPPAAVSLVSLILLGCLRGIEGWRRRRGAALLLSGGLLLLGLPFHGAAGVYGFAGLWFALLLGCFRLPAHELV